MACVSVGGEGPQAYVWYVAYGSNLQLARFRLYLEGGPHPWSGTPHAGARDATPPRAARRFEVPHRLLFARDAPSWGGGGVAFLDPRAGSGTAVGRGWLITREQLADVLAQEAGCTPPTLTDELLLDPGPVEVAPPSSWYGVLLPLGRHDGWPAATFTGAGAGALAPAAPGPAYRAVVLAGLLELGLAQDDAEGYLARCGA